MALDSTKRFSSRVDNYARYRPGYPTQIIELMKSECGLLPEHVIADIASGTGIFSRLLLESGNRVFAVEPNAEMRAAGDKFLSQYKNIASINGTAEATTLFPHTMDFVTAAQAAHWFDPLKANVEFKRISNPADGLCWYGTSATSTPPSLRITKNFFELMELITLKSATVALQPRPSQNYLRRHRFASPFFLQRRNLITQALKADCCHPPISRRLGILFTNPCCKPCASCSIATSTMDISKWNTEQRSISGNSSDFLRHFAITLLQIHAS